MLSPRASDVSRKPKRRRAGDTAELWNRRLHFYLGLYLLFFVWLFALTGLLLNHPGWRFAEFWPNRKQTTFERRIEAPPPGSDLTQARNLLGQLGLAGEIEWTSARADARRLDFRAGRPGHMFEVRADFDGRRATVQRTDINAWGVLHILHTFTGVRAGDSRNQRDWVLTSMWAWTMDAVAIGLLAMVLGSHYMWWRLQGKRAWGLAALISGWAACLMFGAGLRLLL